MLLSLQHVAAGVLALSCGVRAHGLWNAVDIDTATTSNLTQRDNTNCGPSYGGAVCAANSCCSIDGVCGTGAACRAPDCLFQYGPACDANQTPTGTSTSSVSRPKFGNVGYGVTITQCQVPGKVALTFDDGPWLYTNDLLDLLKSQNVKATFFMVANNGGKGQIELESTGWPTVMRRAYNEGHQIASHTWSHQDLSTLTTQQITDQVVKNEIAFADVFGFFPTYIRPPYGRCSGDCLSVLGNLGYHVVTWNVDTLDWQENYPNSQSIFSSAIKNSNPSSNSFIPLTHDIHYGTVHGFVQYMLDTLRAAGYSTALVGECLNDPRSNWYRDASSGQPWSGTVPSPTSSSKQAASPTPSSTPTTSTSSIVPWTTSARPTSTASSTTTPSSGSHTSSSKGYEPQYANLPSSSTSSAAVNTKNAVSTTTTTSATAVASGTSKTTEGLGGAIISGIGPTSAAQPKITSGSRTLQAALLGLSMLLSALHSC